MNRTNVLAWTILLTLLLGFMVLCVLVPTVGSAVLFAIVLMCAAGSILWAFFWAAHTVMFGTNE